MIQQIAEQVVYCLWGVAPIEKRGRPKHVVDHNCTPTEVSLEYCEIVYDILRPQGLPNFIGPSTPGTVMEEDKFPLCKIVKLIGLDVHFLAEFQQKHLTQQLVFPSDEVDMDRLGDAIQDVSTLHVLKMDIPNISSELIEHYGDIFYYIGDYYLKGCKIQTAEKYYLIDLCLNPERTESVCALCLCYDAQIEAEMVNRFNFDNPNRPDFQEKGNCMVIKSTISANERQRSSTSRILVNRGGNEEEEGEEDDRNEFSLEATKQVREDVDHEVVDDTTSFNVNLLSTHSSSLAKENPITYSESISHTIQTIDKARFADLGPDFDRIYPLYLRLCYTYYLSEKNIVSENSHTMHTEFGSLNYALASCCSQMLQRYEIYGSSEDREIIGPNVQLLRQMCLRRSLSSYLKADKCTDQCHREEWLHYFMFGKLVMKAAAEMVWPVLSESDPWVRVANALAHFYRSIEELNARGAVIPRRINYSNAPCLSKELTYMHYMMASSYLKWRVKLLTSQAGEGGRGDEGLPSYMRTCPSNQVNLMKATASTGVCVSLLENVVNHKKGFVCKVANAKQITMFVDKLRNPTDINQISQGQTMPCVHDRLTKMCIQILIAVLKRYREHYKSNYRLAWFFLNDPEYFCPELSQTFLLNRNSTWAAKNAMRRLNFRKSGQLDISSLRDFQKILSPGLFSDQTKNNMFNGIWRVSTGAPQELERPGSFSMAMFKSVCLLIKLMSDEPQELFKITMQFNDRPDSRLKFVDDGDRVYLCRLAYFESVNAYHRKLSEMHTRAKDTSVPNASCLRDSGLSTSSTQIQKAYEASLLKDVFTTYHFGYHTLGIHDNPICMDAVNMAYKIVFDDATPDMDAITRFCINKRGDIFAPQNRNPHKNVSSSSHVDAPLRDSTTLSNTLDQKYDMLSNTKPCSKPALKSTSLIKGPTITSGNMSSPRLNISTIFLGSSQGSTSTDAKIEMKDNIPCAQLTSSNMPIHDAPYVNEPSKTEYFFSGMDVDMECPNSEAYVNATENEGSSLGQNPATDSAYEAALKVDQFGLDLRTKGCLPAVVSSSSEAGQLVKDALAFTSICKDTSDNINTTSSTVSLDPISMESCMNASLSDEEMSI